MIDPRQQIADQPMRLRQWAIVILCIALNALDGFDVLSISFASPGIAADWHIDRSTLGVVLSLELFGMIGGSLALGALCDRWGRRPTVLLCLAVMASGMAVTAQVGGLAAMAACRLYTGVGIGGMLAATNAVVAEFANTRRKHLCVTLMAGGYPLGAVVGGSLASVLLAHHAWQSVFVVGAVTSAALLPVTAYLLPETVWFLLARRRGDPLPRVNRVLGGLGHDLADGLPPRDEAAGRPPLARLFAADLRPITLLTTLIYFTHMMTFYFILKWAPKIVVDLGYAASAAGSVLVSANIGGLAGAVLFSLLSQRVEVRRLAVGSTLLSVAFVALFGQSPPGLGSLRLLAALAGVFTNGTVVCLYAILATRFPTSVRAFGTGFAIGVGRGGAALSPIIVGQLFAAGLSIGATAALIGCGSLAACLLLLALGRWERPPSTPLRQAAT